LGSKKNRISELQRVEVPMQFLKHMKRITSVLDGELERKSVISILAIAAQLTEKYGYKLNTII
jgi:hypothetical protein